LEWRAESKDPERKDKKLLVEAQTAAVYFPWQALALLKKMAMMKE
jgi:hypothetical protein